MADDRNDGRFVCRRNCSPLLITYETYTCKKKGTVFKGVNPVSIDRLPLTGVSSR